MKYNEITKRKGSEKMGKVFTTNYTEVFNTLCDEEVYIKENGKKKKFYVDDLECIEDDEYEGEPVWELELYLVSDDDILSVRDYLAFEDEVCDLFKKVLSNYGISAKRILDVSPYETENIDEDFQIEITYE